MSSNGFGARGPITFCTRRRLKIPTSTRGRGRSACRSIAESSRTCSLASSGVKSSSAISCTANTRRSREGGSFRTRRGTTMRNLMIAAIVALSVAAVAAQGQPAAKNTYKVPRTADGQPHFQGYWTNLTYTPYERPKALANKPYYTKKEAIDPL